MLVVLFSFVISAILSWRNGAGLSWLGYVHLAGDLMAFCFCVGLAAAVQWARSRFEDLPPVNEWMLRGFQAFFILKGVGSGLDFGLLLWPREAGWIVVEVLLKLGVSLAAGMTFALVIHELPRLRSIHASLYIERLVRELWRARKSTPPLG
jgi:hypothetical protein